MKCIIKTASLISICSFAFSCSVFAEAQSKDYFNQSHVPVALTVPYYDQSGNALTNLDIILQPGDVYQPSDHGNGFLYKKYGLMPDMASNYILVLNDRIPRFHDNSNETVDEEFLRIKEAIASTNVPDWWIEKKIEDFKIKEDAYKSNLDHLKEMRKQYEERKSEFSKPDQRKILDEEYAKTFRKIERKIHVLSEVTNITEKSFRQLKNPKADTDKDGLSNFEEFFCDSNPLLKNGVAVYPHILEIKPNGCDVITNTFIVANLTKTNSIYRLDSPNEDIGKKFAPVIKAMDLPNATNERGQLILNLKPKQKAKIKLLLKKELLAYRMLNYYTLKICPTDFFATDPVKALLKLYVSDEQHPELIQPEIISPESGSLLQSLKNVKFAWSRTNENTSVYFSSVPAYNVFVYDDNGREADFAYGGLGWTKGDHTVIREDRCDNIKPGNYIWRVVKQDAYNSPVCSGWGWFAVGKEISPEDAELKQKPEPFDARLSRRGFVFVVGEHNNKWLSYENSDKKHASYFLSPLPKGLKLEVLDLQRPGWYLHGSAEAPGCFTNYYVSFAEDRWTTNQQVIAVINPLNKIKTSSVYHVTSGAVLHELTVNVPFEYSAKEYYTAFEGKNGPELTERAQTEFSPELPEGFAYRKENDDLIVFGCAKKAGAYTNHFVVSDGDCLAKQKHIFKIQDIGEPAPEKKPEDKRKKRAGENAVSFLATHKPGLIVHRMKVGKKEKYPMGLDWMSADPALKGNMKNEEQVDVEFLRPLPEGFMLSIESEEIKDKIYDYFMLSSNPRREGTFTNIARIVNTDFVYTNTHIFIVEP